MCVCSSCQASAGFYCYRPMLTGIPCLCSRSFLPFLVTPPLVQSLGVWRPSPLSVRDGNVLTISPDDAFDQLSIFEHQH